MRSLLILMACAASTYAAPPNFDHLLDDAKIISSGRSMITTSDGALLIAGFAASKDTKLRDDRPQVIRMSAAGEIIWQRSYPALGQSYPVGIVPAPDGGAYLVIRRIDRRASPAWLHIDGKGAVLGQADIGAPGWVPAGVAAVRGGVVVVGDAVTAKGGRSPWLEGLDAQGAQRWRHAFEKKPGALRGVAASPDGKQIAAVGWARGGKGQANDAWIILIGADGTRPRSTLMGGPGMQTFRTAAARRGGWVAGGSKTDAKGRKPWVVGLTARGTQEWSWGSPVAGDVKAVFSGPKGVLVAGISTSAPTSSYGSAWIAALDPRGVQQWQRAYGDGQMDAIDAVVRHADGIVAIGRHSSRKSYLYGFWAFGVDAKGEPAGKRVSRGTP